MPQPCIIERKTVRSIPYLHLLKHGTSYTVVKQVSSCSHGRSLKFSQKRQRELLRHPDETSRNPFTKLIGTWYRWAPALWAFLRLVLWGTAKDPTVDAFVTIPNYRRTHFSVRPRGMLPSLVWLRDRLAYCVFHYRVHQRFSRPRLISGPCY